MDNLRFTEQVFRGGHKGNSFIKFTTKITSTRLSDDYSWTDFRLYSSDIGWAHSTLVGRPEKSLDFHFSVGFRCFRRTATMERNVSRLGALSGRAAQYSVITAHWPGGIVVSVCGTCTVFFSLFKGWWQAEKINRNQIKHSWARRGSAECVIYRWTAVFFYAVCRAFYPPTSHNGRTTCIVVIIITIIYGRLLRYGLLRSENRISRTTDTLDFNYNANVYVALYRHFVRSARDGYGKCTMDLLRKINNFTFSTELRYFYNIHLRY